MLGTRSMRSDALRYTASAALAAFLAVGFPLPGVDVSVGARAATTSDGALTVTTDPAQASVYVDGQLQGTTPIHLETLATGDHRIRLVKVGYLENARIVEIKAGEQKELRVNLTQVPEGPTETTGSVTSTGGSGGRHKRLLLVGLGAAAVGGGAYFLLRDTNDPPNAGSISPSPSVGLASVTTMSFSVSGASDPNGDPLSYSWDLGDGATASGANASHTYASAGNYTVRVTVSDGKLSANATISVVIRDLAGRWTGSYSSGHRFTVQLSQSGTSLKGTWQANWDSSRSDALSGTITAPNKVRIELTYFCDVWQLEVNEAFDQMSGTATCPNSTYHSSVTLTR